MEYGKFLEQQRAILVILHQISGLGQNPVENFTVCSAVVHNADDFSIGHWSLPHDAQSPAWGRRTKACRASFRVAVPIPEGTGCWPGRTLCPEMRLRPVRRRGRSAEALVHDRTGAALQSTLSENRPVKGTRKARASRAELAAGNGTALSGRSHQDNASHNSCKLLNDRSVYI